MSFIYVYDRVVQINQPNTKGKGYCSMIVNISIQIIGINIFKITIVKIILNYTKSVGILPLSIEGKL